MKKKSTSRPVKREKQGVRHHCMRDGFVTPNEQGRCPHCGGKVAKV